MIPKHRPTHPGEFIQEDILQEFGLTQTQLAKALGVSRQTITQLVNQKGKITLDMAQRLGQFTQTSPELWLNLQSAVDLWEEFNQSQPQSPLNTLGVELESLNLSSVHTVMASNDPVYDIKQAI